MWTIEIVEKAYIYDAWVVVVVCEESSFAPSTKSSQLSSFRKFRVQLSMHRSANLGKMKNIILSKGYQLNKTAIDEK